MTTRLRWSHIDTAAECMSLCTPQTPRWIWKLMYSALRGYRRAMWAQMYGGKIGTIYGVRVIPSHYGKSPTAWSTP